MCGNFHEIADDGLEVATGMMFVDDPTFVRYGGGLGKRRFDRLAPRLGLIGSVDTEQVVTIVTLNGVVEIRELDVSLEII